MSGRPALRHDMRKGWCPGALRPMMARDGLLVRLRITGGIVPAKLAQAIADLAGRHGNGLLDLSARANLQLRGVRETSLPALLDGLDALGLLDADPAAEAVRNVLASPLAGLGRHTPPQSGRGGLRKAWWRGQPPLRSFESCDAKPTSIEARQPPPPPSAVPLPRSTGEDAPDIRPLVAALEHALVTDSALRALPAKFGVLVDDGGEPSLAGIAADIHFDWNAAERAFAVGLGGTARDALTRGLVAPDKLVQEAVALAHRLLAFPGPPRRIHGIVRDVGRDAAAAWFGAQEPSPQPASAAPRVVGHHDFHGVQTLGLASPFGRLDTVMLRSAARLAVEVGCGELRLTPWRAILVPHIAPGEADVSAGFIVDPGDPRLRVAACTGIAGCDRGTTNTHVDGASLARLAASLPGDDVSLHVSGCAKGCARPRRTAVTLVGRDGRYDLVRDGCPGDEPVLTDLDQAAIRDALRGFEQRVSPRGTGEDTRGET